MKIYSKTMPLILPQESLLVDRWLDTQFNEAEQFEHLLQPHIPQNFITYQIDKPMTHKSIFDSQLINLD
jgi:hypothetical protein